jgi:hypothetical protein
MSREVREAERAKAIDLMLSCRTLVEKAKAELDDAEAVFELITELVRRGRLDLSGGWLPAMEADMYSLRSAVGLAKETLEAACKAITRASSSLVESNVASQIDDGGLAIPCMNDVDKALSDALARLEEARPFALTASKIYSKVRFPRLYVRA